MKSLNRRDLGKVAAGLVLGAAVAPARADELSLKDRAARRGMMFGCCVQRDQLVKDAGLARAVANESSMIVGEWEMKWGAIEPTRGTRDYSKADGLADFAARHGMGLRGHVATWYHNLPPWAPAAFREPGGKAVLDRHVAEVIGHFRGRISQWDVVNEAVAPENRRPDGLRNTILLQTLGPAHIRDSFLIAREADPDTMLFYNEAALEYDTPVQAARRRATLQLLETLVKSKAPVQALGIQGHLEPGSVPFSAREFRGFLKEVAALGLKILITEFDVSDRSIDGDFPVRDRAVADAGKEFLDVAFDEPAMMGVVTWGLSDRYTWLNGKHRWARTDGKPNRALPLDAALNRKPLWEAMASAFDHAPARTP